MYTMKDMVSYIDKSKSVTIFKPEVCPYCDHGIDAKIVHHFYEDTNHGVVLFVVMKCPVCGEIFFCTYNLGLPYDAYTSDYTFPYVRIIGGGFMKESFSNEIKTLSPSFVNIYNQSYQAEQEGLSDICGMGYRKAFEFLVKDYLIAFNPKEKETIIKSSLSMCINKYFSYEDKQIFDRASWLGNDESHYFYNHDNFDYNDLKQIIQICISKVEMKIKEKNYITSIQPKRS